MNDSLISNKDDLVKSLLRSSQEIREIYNNKKMIDYVECALKRWEFHLL